MVFLSVMMLMFTVMPGVSEASSYSKEDLIEIKKMEEELRFYFEEVGEFNDYGEYIVKDETLFFEKVEAGDPNALALYELLQLTSENTSPTYEIQSATSFAKCVGNKFVNSYGNIARQFMTGAIFTYIKTKQYDLAARLMFNTLVKAGFKVNAVGLAAEAAMYGWQCRGEW